MVFKNWSQMKAFRKWWESCKWFFNCAVNAHWVECGWRASLEWYKGITDEYEKDCTTDEDFRTLYFHLKQVLENELK